MRDAPLVQREAVEQVGHRSRVGVGCQDGTAFAQNNRSGSPTRVPRDNKNAHVAYMREADRDDPERESFNDGDYAVHINVTDQNIVSGENAHPVMTLRMRYNRWKARGDRGRTQKPTGH